MTPTITAFERSPDRGRGQARDMRVRRALEEAVLEIIRPGVEAGRDAWMNGSTEHAFALARPYPAAGMRIVHSGEMQDPYRA
jgi:hypothetical protein